jgi:hypothetical protein
MTLRITFHQMFCKDDTTGLGADEIYLLAVPRLLRNQNGTVEMLDRPGARSEVKRDVKTKTRYQPKLVSGKSSFEVQLDPTSKSMVLVLFLFEEDNSAHYKALRESPSLAAAPIEETEWGKIKDFIPSDVSSWKGWLKSAYKLIVRTVGAIAKDDLIGKRVITIDPEKPATLGFRQFRFEGNGGEYHLTLQIETV